MQIVSARRYLRHEKGQVIEFQDHTHYDKKKNYGDSCSAKTKLQNWLLYKTSCTQLEIYMNEILNVSAASRIILQG